MAARAAVCVLAEGTSIDQITGRVTAFNMLDSVLSKAVPALLPRLMVTTTYEVDGEAPQKFVERVSVIAPNGDEVASSVTEITTSSFAHNSIHALWALRLSEFGAYRVVVSNAPTQDGPWTTAVERRLMLVDRAHPLWDANGPQPQTPGGKPAITQ